MPKPESRELFFAWLRHFRVARKHALPHAEDVEPAPDPRAMAVDARPGADPEARATFELDVPGMHCRGCEAKIEMLLRAREGVDHVTADATSNRVRVDFRPDRTGIPELEDALASLGYPVRGAHKGDAP